MDRRVRGSYSVAGVCSTIESSMNWIDVSVSVEITSLLGEKLSENLGSEPIRFDVSANLEEKDRRSGRIILLFSLTVRTKPSVAKYEVEGTTTLNGKDQLIDKMLEADPQSKIPFVFHRIYQHVFTALYMLASTIGTVYPPPDLLSAAPQGVPVKSFGKRETVETSKETEAPEAAEPKVEVETEKTPSQPPKTSANQVSQS